jgi:hypothetical protein
VRSLDQHRDVIPGRPPSYVTEVLEGSESYAVRCPACGFLAEIDDTDEAVIIGVSRS